MQSGGNNGLDSDWNMIKFFSGLEFLDFHKRTPEFLQANVPPDVLGNKLSEATARLKQWDDADLEKMRYFMDDVIGHFATKTRSPTEFRQGLEDLRAKGDGINPLFREWVRNHTSMLLVKVWPRSLKRANFPWIFHGTPTEGQND